MNRLTRSPLLWPLLALAALLLPVPATVLLEGVAVMAAILALGLLWAPAMALLSEAAEVRGLDLGFAAALVNLAWAGGQVIGGTGSAGLAEATSDAIPYLAVAGLCVLTSVLLLSAQRRLVRA